jgi:protein-tyrosine phosphatase
MTSDLYWIPGPWRGRLAIASRPRGGDWLSDELRAWRNAGIDVAVSLLEEDEANQLELANEAAEAETAGIRYVSFPIPDRGIPASTTSAAGLIARISEELEAGKNVALHCRQGLGRSGMIAASVLTHAGLNSDDAIQAVSSARRQNIPETAEQRAWIERSGSRRPVMR